MPALAFRLSQLGGVHLYCGPELVSAVQRTAESAAAASARAAPARLRVPGVSAIAAALNAPSLRLLPQNVLVRGTERASGATMRVLFSGQSRSVDFCAQHILGNTDFERVPAAAAGPQACDVMVLDHPLLGFDPFGRYPSLHVPQWVRQQCELAPTWQQTLEHLPRSLRKLIASDLRTPGLAASLDVSPSALPDFYSRLYVPFVRERFGPAAIVPSERAFLRQVRDAVLLTLRVGGELVGATVLKQGRDTLFISRTALSPQPLLRYRSEVLDYFCFLLAQLTDMRWLDFGVSRPHLEDGVLLYKAKWRPRLGQSGGLKNSIHIRPASRSVATLGFLQRNGFIEHRAGGYAVRCLRERAPDGDEALRLSELATRVGLDALIVGYSEAREARAEPAAPRLLLHRIEAAADPVRALLGRP